MPCIGLLLLSLPFFAAFGTAHPSNNPLASFDHESRAECPFAKRATSAGTTQDFDAALQLQSDTSLLTADNITYTRANGQPYPQPYEAQYAGENGPLLLQDMHLIELMAHFDRERIPERVVHAKGAGAHGTFTCTSDWAKNYTIMEPFQTVGLQTPITIRFSTVGGESGSADEARDPRGFAIKWRTKSGIWDLVMNNTPVFFIRDPAKFPHFIHTQKRNPQTHQKDPDMFWDYMSLNEESLHQFMRLFSDLGTPQGFTHMHGWSGHTYRWVKTDGSWVYVRLYAESAQGVMNFTASEAATIQAQNPDYATKDLFDRIENGTFPSWTLYGQVLTPSEAESFRYNVFDLTKEWPLDLVKPQELGKFELTQNPLNYFAEIEQAAFSPANTIDGWEPSNDPVLQTRLFSYPDAHRHRLGPNHMQIPVNSPINPVANFQRDGFAAVTGNQGSRYAYISSLQSIGLPPRPYDDSNHTNWTGNAIRSMSTISPIDFEQPANFWKNLSKTDQDNLVSNVVGHLTNAKSTTVKERVATVWGKADADLGKRIAQGVSVQYTQGVGGATNETSQTQGNGGPTDGTNVTSQTQGIGGPTDGTNVTSQTQGIDGPTDGTNATSPTQGVGGNATSQTQGVGGNATSQTQGVGGNATSQTQGISGPPDGTNATSPTQGVGGNATSQTQGGGNATSQTHGVGPKNSTSKVR